MDDVWNQVDVALPATPTGVCTERLLHGEAQEEQFDVMDIELVRGLPLACTFLEVSVVPRGSRTNIELEVQFLVTAQVGRQNPLWHPLGLMSTKVNKWTENEKELKTRAGDIRTRQDHRTLSLLL